MNGRERYPPNRRSTEDNNNRRSFPGIPYALHEAGFGLGMILLVFVAYVTDYSLILMVRSGHIAGKFSYQGIMEAAFGRPGYILLSLLQFIYPFIGKQTSRCNFRSARETDADVIV